MGDFLTRFFSTSDFPPRWQCGNWSEFLGWLHIGSDVAIWAAYFTIPVILVAVARRRDDFPFSSLFWLFAAFILACGLTHIVEAIIFWTPIYRIAGAVKFMTAVISWCTVVALVRLAPQILALPSLAATNEQLTREVEERRRVESQLRVVQKNLLQQKQELELMYETAPVGMSLMDRELRYVRINKSLARINGLPAEQHIGRTLREVVGDLAENIEPLYRKVFETGKPMPGLEITGRTAGSERTRTWLARYYPLRTPSDSESGSETVTMVSAIVQDITRQKAQEERLRQSERAALDASRAKSEFLANMSHEIRTPMTAILGHVDILSETERNEEDRRSLSVIRRNGEYLLELIGDILDLSRIEAGRMEIESVEFSVPELLTEVESLMRVRTEAKGLRFEIIGGSESPLLMRSDPKRLRQILLNLIGNAVKFTDSGTIRVSAENGADSQTVRFSVSDTGIGIAPDRLADIFDAFVQGDSSPKRSYEGSGLGLAICRRLTDMLGGTIEAANNTHGGATFTVTLPTESPGTPASGHIPVTDSSRVSPPAVPETVGSAAVTDLPVGCRILVADDQRDVRHITRHFLTRAGAEVTTAENGREAVDTLLAHSRGESPFQAVIMDVQMPGLDGLAAARELRAAGITVPIVALTADAMSGDRERCLSAGCSDYLAKPVDRGELIAKVAQCLNRTGEHSAGRSDSSELSQET